MIKPNLESNFFIEKGITVDTIKQRIKAVIFDMDGTIIDTDPIWDQVNFDILAGQGVKSLTDIQFKEMSDQITGASLPKCSKILKEMFGLPISEEEIFRQFIDFSNVHFHKEKCEFIHGFENFHKMLVQHGIPSSIATNASPECLEGLIRVNGFERFFGENIYCPRHVGCKVKPDPSLFLHAASKLGVKPEQCIVFEDSFFGFQAAKAAGMKCIAIKNHRNAHLLDHVDGFIESYDYALDVLKTL